MKESRRMVSIIIAAHNEEKVIGQTLSELVADVCQEIIVVDGGSHDRTFEVVAEFPVRLIKTKKNRAYQFNQGAKESCGDVLIFLHADCILEKGSIAEIEGFIEKGYVGGCLQQRIKDDKQIYRSIESSGNVRAKLFRIFYGDQAIFVRRDVFFKVGGYDEVDLFDDVMFSKKLRGAGKTAVLGKKVYTYPRRWQKQGIIRTTVINWLVSLGFIFGVSPRILKKVYQDIR